MWEQAAPELNMFGHWASVTVHNIQYIHVNSHIQGQEEATPASFVENFWVYYSSNHSNENPICLIVAFTFQQHQQCEISRRRREEPTSVGRGATRG
jgi:hypothetical protein